MAAARAPARPTAARQLDLGALGEDLSALGLILRGGFHPGPEDGLPALPDGRPAATLLLVGNAGADLWSVFGDSAELTDGRPDPLNRWTERVLGDLARDWRAGLLFPFGGPPYWPFLAWSKRCEPVAESPLGMLIHPDYGLWHAYRAALLLAERLALPTLEARPRPCETCAGRPCLSACPVGAFAESGGYDVAACAGHLETPAGADCLSLACRARRACPAGAAYVYPPALAAFHMDAFLGARRREASP